MKKVIELAFQEATSAGAELVGTEHLLAALLVEAEGVAPRALNELGVSLRKVRRAIRAGVEDRVAQQDSTTTSAPTTSSVRCPRAGPPSSTASCGSSPEVVVADLAIPEEVRQLGLATRRARIEHAAAFMAGGTEAVRAAEEVDHLGREHSEAVSR